MKKQYYSFYKEPDVKPFMRASRCTACGNELSNCGILVCSDCWGVGIVEAPPKAPKMTHLPRSHSIKKK